MLRYDDDGDDDSDDDNDDIDAFLRSLLQGENDTSSFSDNDSETADLLTFTEEILNGKLLFLCSVLKLLHHYPFFIFMFLL